MINDGSANPQQLGPSEDRLHPDEAERRGVWRRFHTRLLVGLMVLSPILVTLWIMRWLILILVNQVIDPLVAFVLWKTQLLQKGSELPYWFETYVAPLIAIFIAVAILYGCGTFAHSQFRRAFDKVMLRVPVVSLVYDSVRNVLQSFEKPQGQPAPRRVVLVSFPHPGMRVPAIVTSTLRDVATQRQLLCVYVPTTPIPTSGFFLMVPEEDVTELNWSVEQTLQAIISGGLTAPREVTYFRNPFAAGGSPDNSAGPSRPGSISGG